MGDRVAVLKDGYLQQVDTPQNLYDRPVNVFVGAFIGSPSMNLYEGTVDSSGDVGTVTIGSHVVGLPRSVSAKQPKLRDYDGKRDHHRYSSRGLRGCRIGRTGPGEPACHATVTLLEALGSEIMVHFRLDARPSTPATPMPSRTSQASTPRTPSGDSTHARR